MSSTSGQSSRPTRVKGSGTISSSSVCEFSVQRMCVCVCVCVRERERERERVSERERERTNERMSEPPLSVCRVSECVCARASQCVWCVCACVVCACASVCVCGVRLHLNARVLCARASQCGVVCVCVCGVCVRASSQSPCAVLVRLEETQGDCVSASSLTDSFASAFDDFATGIVHFLCCFTLSTSRNGGHVRFDI